MRPQILSQTGAGQSVMAVMDANRNPFSVSVGVVVSGTVSYTIEHSYDDPQRGAANMTWFSKTALSAQTANKDDAYLAPVRAIRINQATGSGTTTLTILQAGHGVGG